MSQPKNNNTGRQSPPWLLLAMVAVVAFAMQGSIVAIVHNLMLIVVGVTGILVAGGVAALGLILRDHRGSFTWLPPETPRGSLRPRPQDDARFLTGQSRQAIEAARVIPGEVLAEPDAARQARDHG